MRRAAVLGSTGIVGQRLMAMLWMHPWFEPVPLTLSPNKAGARYGQAVDWVIDRPMPEGLGDLVIEAYELSKLKKLDVDFVISALPSGVAAGVEPELAGSGFPVVSNAGFMRLEPDVPLINPEVNASHIGLVEEQRVRRGWGGFIAKVPNCTTSILTLTLKPIMDVFGIDTVAVTSMQAISGAGYHGLPAVKIAGNVIPYIKGEEDKIREETKKILGKLEGGKITKAGFAVMASTNRVPVLDGHTLSVFVKTFKPAEPEDVAAALEEFAGNQVKGMGLPTAPPKPVEVLDAADRPQPRLDTGAGGGMTVTVGRVRKDPDTGWIKYVALGHNTVRGAAGNAVLISELLLRKGLI